MKILITAILTMTLSGCALFGSSAGNEKPSVVQQNYVTKSAPAELYEIPDYPKLVVTESTSQADIAIWITKLEENILNLENKIKQLHEFFESKPSYKIEETKK